MSTNYDVIIAGEVFCDLIFTGLPTMPRLGEELYAAGFDMVVGGTFITAVTLHRLGVRVGLVTHLGNDPTSRFVLGEMENEGLDMSLVNRVDRPLRTVTAALSFAEDRAFVTYADPRPEEPTPAQALSGVHFKHLHIHYLGQLWEHPQLVELAREHGATISLDSQHCPEVMSRPDLAEKLAEVDTFMPNRTEALQIAGTEDEEVAIAALSQLTPTVIVKLGERGAIALHRGERFKMPALPVQAVDTTGAGDAFAGGYIFGLLTRLPFSGRLKTATICGGLSTTARGGATHAPRLPELQEWMGKEW